ncbi:MAG: hypothetical protein LBV55_03455 [Acholeplasmatales bacterium]|jgi:hypothetical protein|nr:hypothetical protein [Acholeplasmatales bacterium]
MKKNIIFILIYGLGFLAGLLFLIIASVIFYYKPVKNNNNTEIFFNYDSQLIHFGSLENQTTLVSNVNLKSNSIISIEYDTTFIRAGEFIYNNQLIGYGDTSEEILSPVSGRVIKIENDNILILDYNEIYLVETNVSNNLLTYLTVGNTYESTNQLSFILEAIEYNNGYYSTTFKYISTINDNEIFFSQNSSFSLILNTVVLEDVYYFEYNSGGSLINSYYIYYFIDLNDELVRTNDVHITRFSNSIYLIEAPGIIDGYYICLPI